jgi:hypothetical protein
MRAARKARSAPEAIKMLRVGPHPACSVAMKPRRALGLVMATVVAALAAAWLTPQAQAPSAPAHPFGAPAVLGVR